MSDINSDSTCDSSAPKALDGQPAAHMSSYLYPYLSGPSLDVYLQGDPDSNTNAEQDSGIDGE
jgi:hypothetical protein